MATLYDISWAFTVYHLLQLPLNATGHKRQSSSHFIEGKGAMSPVQILQSQKGFHMLKCAITNRFIDSDGTFGNSNSVYLDGWMCDSYNVPWSLGFPVQISNAGKMCSRVGLRCSWGTVSTLMGLSLVFLFRCSQCYSLMCLRRAGSERSHFSREISEKNAPLLSIPLWGQEIKWRKLEVPAKPLQDSSFR